MNEARTEGFRSVVTDRFSCRAFLPTELDPALLDELFTLAQLAPSWCNVQPWHVTLVSGKDARAFGEALGAHAEKAPRAPDFDAPETYPAKYGERRRQVGYALYDSVGIERSDRRRRAEQAAQNFALFGAPHVAIITTDSVLGPYGAIDTGGYITALLLAAESLGVASIAQAALATHPDFVRHYLGLPAAHRIVCGISLGLPDLSHPANGFRAPRAPLAEAVTVWRSGGPA